MGFLWASVGPSARGQQPFTWPEGKKAAVSLTFDDGRASQIEEGLDVFAPHDIRVTFYVMPGAVKQRIEGWRRAVDLGHEIGNHSMHHPCSNNFEWVREEQALEGYSIEQMDTELADASVQLKTLLDIEPVSFAYPCGLTYVGNGETAKSYIPVVARQFTSGRRWLSESDNDPIKADLAQLTGMEMDGKSFDEIKELVDSAVAKGRWLVLAGHEIGFSGDQTTQIPMLEALIAYLSTPNNPVWLAPVGDVTSYILEQRATR